MDLKRAAEAYGTDRFAETLRAEIGRQMDTLPLEEACKAGGYPIAASAEVRCGAFAGDGRAIVGEITVCFDEEVNPGCGNSAVTHWRSIDCRIEINRADGTAGAKAREAGDEPEF